MPNALLKQAFLLEDRLELRHNDAISVTQFQMAHHRVSMGPQSTPELLLCHIGELAELQGKLLALLKEYLLVHIFLGDDVFGVGFLVQVGTVVVQTVRTLQEEAAVLCAPIRGVEQPPIEDELVYSEDGEGGLPLTGVVDVR